MNHPAPALLGERVPRQREELDGAPGEGLGQGDRAGVGDLLAIQVERPQPADEPDPGALATLRRAAAFHPDYPDVTEALHHTLELGAA